MSGEARPPDGHDVWEARFVLLTPAQRPTDGLDLRLRHVLGDEKSDAGAGRFFTVYNAEASNPIPDEALRACVSDAVASGRISSAAQLQDLDCSGLGIADLSGIGTFTGLESLRLSDNAIRDLAPLEALSSLEELYLDSNQVVDPVPLFGLLSLRTLDISRNSDLKCPSSVSLLRAQEIRLPRHCR